MLTLSIKITRADKITDLISGHIRLESIKSIKDYAYRLFRIIMFLTPVDTASWIDGGSLKRNWVVGIGGRAAASDSGGPSELPKILSISNSVWPIPSLHLSNYSPYADVVDSGLYPSIPKKGTWVPSGGSKHGVSGPTYYKFSSGGFSKIAKQGMINPALRVAGRFA